MLLAAALAGCASQTTSDIHVTDRGTFIPAGRVSIDIASRGEAPSQPHTGHAIELGATGASGEDRQQLAAGARPVVFGSRTFNAPTELRHDFDFSFVEIAYRFRKFFGAGGFGIEALAGVGHAGLDLTVASPAQSANEKLGNAGLVGGFGLLWRFLPATSLQSRLTLFNSGKVDGVTSAARLDLYVAHAFGRNVALRAGIAGWDVRSEREERDSSSSVTSPIRVRFSGPALGLDVAF